MGRIKISYQAIIIIEIISTILIGLVLLYPFGKLELSIIVWALGVMITIATLAISEKVEREIKEGIEDIQNINEIFNLYINADDEDFNEIRNDAINDVRNRLLDLSKKVATVDATVFYLWLQSQFTKCKKNIKAVSTVEETLWYTDPQENNFLAQNVKAAKRGVIVKRFFISTKERLRNSANRRIIRAHIENNIHPSIIWWDNIKKDKKLTEVIKDGFVIIDDRILLSDVRLKGETIGRISKNTTEIDKLLSTFTQMGRYIMNYHAKNEQDRYIDILKILAKDFEMEYGKIEKLKQSGANLDEKQKKDLNDWSELIEEIKASASRK